MESENPFSFRVMKAQWRYKLTNTYIYYTGIKGYHNIGNKYVELSPEGYLYMRAGYSWDGPSGPTLDTPDFMRASLVHDALYQLIKSRKLDKKYRKKADDIFYQILIQDKMPWFRAFYSWLALRLFGWVAV